MAMAPPHWNRAAKKMMATRFAVGEGGREALRILKRCLCEVVCAALIQDLISRSPPPRRPGWGGSDRSTGVDLDDVDRAVIRARLTWVQRDVFVAVGSVEGVGHDVYRF